MLIKRILNQESSYEISLKLDEKFSRSISYSGQTVFFQFLHYTCFSSAMSVVSAWLCTTPFKITDSSTTAENDARREQYTSDKV